MRLKELSQICDLTYDILEKSISFSNIDCYHISKQKGAKYDNIPIQGFSAGRGFYFYYMDYIDDCIVDEIEYIDFKSLKLKDKVNLIDKYISYLYEINRTNLQ